MGAITRHETKPLLSKAVEHGGVVYLAGITAEDKTAGAKQQAEQILAAIDRLLAACGTDKSRILTAMVWLSSMSDRPALNEAWTQWVPAGHAPARACVQAGLGPDCLVEIQVTAAK